MNGEPGVWVLALTLLVAGVVLIVVGRKQKAGTLPRNWIAGLRTWETPGRRCATTTRGTPRTRQPLGWDHRSPRVWSRREPR